MIVGPDIVSIVASGHPFVLYRGPRERAEDWIERYKRRGWHGPCVYSLVPVRFCQICGEEGREQREGHYRCRKHINRNPCAIEGCKRSTKADLREVRDGLWLRDYDNEGWLCSTHWRAFVPPHSPERRIYQRFLRRAKRRKERFGQEPWTEESNRAFWRIWRWIVSRARARARGDIDMREINRVMGWE